MQRLSKTERILLHLLSKAGRELYGLELIRASRGALKRGTAYVTLYRMEAKGLVTSKEEEKKDAWTPGIARRFYKPTAAGLSALEIDK